MAVAIPRPTKIEMDAEKCKRDFTLFVKSSWHIIEPSKHLIWNWHMDAICQHLQAVYHRDILRLLVNIQPGVAKSTIFSTMWPVWCWTNDASIRWLCASHSLDLAIRDNKNSRDLIQSDWYQERYGSFFQLKGDQNVKSYFETTQRGYRMAVAVRGSGTGKRGTHLLIDDPNNAMAGQADIEAVPEWFGRTWMSRLNDLETGTMVVVGQRMHANDLSNHILELGGWEHLNLPTEFEPSKKCFTKIGWEDPRTEEGELLAPQQFSKESLDVLKRSMGPETYSAQYQQDPLTSKGKPYAAEFQRYFTINNATQSYLLETPRGTKPVPIASCWNFCAIDPAISLKQKADFTVMAAYAVTPYRDLVLLEILRKHWTHPEQKDNLVLFHQKYGFQLVAVESVGYQAALIQAALLEGVPCIEFKVHTDKVVRSGTASIWDKNGKSYTLKDADWLFEYQKEIFAFPQSPKDDQADTKSMAGIVVCGSHIPGIWDPDDTTITPDDTQSIEEILDATIILEEQAKKEEEERANQEVDPFAWHEAHMGGGAW